MAKARNKFRRLRSGGPYIQAYPEVLDSPELKALNNSAQLLLFRMHMKLLHTDWNGLLAYSRNQAAEECRIDRKTATKAFQTLQNHGFIECMWRPQKNERKARLWRLTFLATPDGREPTDEWRSE